MPVCEDITLTNNNDKNDIFISKSIIKFDTNMDYPLAKYGFQHFIHALKNDTNILSQFENKKKVYLVMNPFERYIFDYDKSIGDTSVKYFDLKDKPNILSRGFYKLWEILFMFDLINIDKDNFVSTHLAEGPGSFIQATMFFRDMFAQKLAKNDKYYAITVHPEDVDGHVPELEKKFTDYYSKEKPVRFILHKTVDRKTAQSGGGLDNGDLTNPRTLYNLCGGDSSTIKEKVDFITADGGFEWVNENIQEQEYFRLLFSQIVTAVNIQKKGGSFVCKFFETFTATSLKYLSILQSLYEKVYLVKPLTSRPSNSEKYAVCIGFKYSEKDSKLKDIINVLNDFHKQIHSSKLNIVDLFSEFKFSDEFISKMIQINRQITNKQFRAIGEIITFVNSQNYYGDVYKEKRDEQIKAAEFWNELFFMETKDYKKNKTKIVELMEKSNKENLNKSKELLKEIKIN